MKIQVVKVLDRGVANKERLWLKVVENCDLNYYIVFHTVYISPTAISGVPRHVHWLPQKQVKAGDYVVLYTGKGQLSESKNSDGSTSHFLYWGLESTICNAPADCLVLIEASTWLTAQ